MLNRPPSAPLADGRRPSKTSEEVITNNYFYKISTEEAETKHSSKSKNLGGNGHKEDAQKYHLLKTENRKLVKMLENSEKLMKAKLKESRVQIDKIMSIINKVWKILQKQILNSQQRRQYFEKNSPEEMQLKKLLKENEVLRSSHESRFKMLDNLGAILDI